MIRIEDCENGYIVSIVAGIGEETVAVFERDDDNVDGIAKGILGVLWYVMESLGGEVGNKHTSKRIRVRLEDNDDNRHERLTELLKNGEVVNKVWEIMEGE